VLVAIAGLVVAWLARRDARTSATATAKAVAIAEEQERRLKIEHEDRLGPQIQQISGVWDRANDAIRVEIRVTGGPALTHIRISVPATTPLPLTWLPVQHDVAGSNFISSNARRGERFVFFVLEVSELNRHPAAADEASVPLLVSIQERDATDGESKWQRLVEVIGVPPAPSGDG
jgi:hypothetical protein